MSENSGVASHNGREFRKHLGPSGKGKFRCVRGLLPKSLRRPNRVLPSCLVRGPKDNTIDNKSQGSGSGCLASCRFLSSMTMFASLPDCSVALSMLPSLLASRLQPVYCLFASRVLCLLVIVNKYKKIPCDCWRCHCTDLTFGSSAWAPRERLSYQIAHTTGSVFLGLFSHLT